MRKGFTLIELMIVVAIIAILAAIVIPRALGNRTGDETEHLNAVRNQGFEDVSFTGESAYYKCQQANGRQFVATNALGARVTGYVCCAPGWGQKGCTIRW